MKPIKKSTPKYKSLIIVALMSVLSVNTAFAQDDDVWLDFPPPETPSFSDFDETSTSYSGFGETSSSPSDSMGIGFGAGLLHMPIDDELQSNGEASSVFIDFDNFLFGSIPWRLGYNTNYSKIELDSSNKTWILEFEANSLYIVYRGEIKMSKNTNMVYLLGLDYMKAEVTTTPGESTSRGSGIGRRLGIGTFYYLGSIGFGIQYEFNSVNIAFDDINIDLGGNQVFALLTLGF